jgi:hypothetical protein
MDMSRESACPDRPPQVSELVIDDLIERFTALPVPDAPFDPSTATPEELRRFGLPPRPDACKQPLLRRVWDRGFGKPMVLRRFAVVRQLVEATVYRPLTRTADLMLVAETRFETSRNWSGSYITANQDRQFMQVWGQWTIPANLQLPPPPFQGPPGVPYTCSNWIGLDGQRRYLNSSLPQIGTVSTLLPNGTTSAQAWTQWWARNSTEIAPITLPLPVSPGDEVLCVLTALDPQRVEFVMVNLSAQPFPEGIVAQGIAPHVTLPNGIKVRPNIAGATAEWILERPRILGQRTQNNFPDYGETEFSLCIAVEADSVNIASLPGGVVQQQRGERLLRMYDVLSGPARTAYISMPRKMNDTSIKVKYGGF